MLNSIRKRICVISGRVVAFFAIALLAESFGAQAETVLWSPVGATAPAISSLAVDNVGVIYAGSSGRVLVSADGGGNWRISSSGLPQRIAIRKIAVDSNRTIYVGGNSGVFRSRDAGASWVQINKGLVFDEYKNIAIKSIVFDRQNTVYLDTQRGVFKSEDGENWIQIKSVEEDSLSINSIAVDSNGTLYVAATNEKNIVWDHNEYTGVFLKSTDEGRHWTEISKIQGVIVNEIKIDKTNTLYVATNGELYKSSDSGNSWVKTLPDGMIDSGIESISIDGENVLYISSMNSIWKSPDKGETWSQLGAAPLGDAIYAYSLEVDGSSVYVGTNEGVFKNTADQPGWSRLQSKGLAGLNIRSLLLDKDNALYAGTWAGGNDGGGVFKKNNGADEWAAINHQIPSRVMVNALVADSKGAIYAGTWGGIFKSTDNGGSWVSVNGLQVNALVVDKAGVLYVGGEGHVFRSANGGDTWAPLGSSFRSVNALAVDSAGAVYAGAYEGIYKITPGEKNWAQLMNGMPDYNPIVNVLAVDDADTVYAGTYNGVFKGPNGGAHWTQHLFPSDNRVTSLAIQNRNTIYVGTFYDGVYKTSDAGDTWVSANAGLPSLNIDSLMADGAGTIYLGMDGGIFKTTSVDKSQVIEFYHKDYDHYFMSANVAEIEALDTGKHKGWVRTGYSFQAYNAPAIGVNPVCRFYMKPEAGDSHFYSASPQECADTASKFSKDWIQESSDVFYISLPDAATGACPQDTRPVWRFFHEAKTNHRYTAEPSLRDHLRTTPGWIAEGYGSDAVIMCAPQ